MLIYEKKVDGERKIFGTLGNIPSDEDQQLTYKDSRGDEYSDLTLTEQYLDNKEGGIIRESTDTEVFVWLGDTRIIPAKNKAIGITVEFDDYNPVVGETLSYEKMTVYLQYNDGTQEELIEGYTATPEAGTEFTEAGEFVITVTYEEFTETYALTVSEPVTVSSIAWTTAPTTTTYTDGQTLDLTGGVVTATYSDTNTADVTSECTFNPANGATLATTDTKVTASYTYEGKTVTADQTITVS